MALQLALCLCVYLLLTQGAQGNVDDFDCVEIFKQPAFQHPLLENHKIPETFRSYGNIERSNNTHTTEELCPKGTVPISRPILRQRNEYESVHLNSADYPGQHFATIETISDGSIYRGAEAEISIHDLKLQGYEYSKSQIWLENGPRGQLNSIHAGLAVHPRLYGDSLTRLTIHWTGDGYRTGCYNTDCPGFVVLSRHKFRLGKPFLGSSVYGKKSFMVQIQVYQDGSGNWALSIFDEVIGYWPKELFTHLNKGASLVRYGGNTFCNPDGTSPPMGNGHFPVADFTKSAYFANVLIMKSDYRRVYVEDRKIRGYVDSDNCFRLTYSGYVSKSAGVAFFFGGPGGNCGV